MNLLNDKLKNLVFSMIMLILSLVLYLGTGSPLALIVVSWGLAAVLMSVLKIKDHITYKIESFAILSMIVLSGLILIYTFLFRSVYLNDQVFNTLFYVFVVGLIIYAILVLRELLKNRNKNTSHE